MEGDAAKPEAIAAWNHFNPLPPHGGRLAATAISTMPSIFQSTPSAWRETTKNKRTRNILKNFNPLPPHGGRPAKDYATAFEKDISIHSLRMEGDLQRIMQQLLKKTFQSTPSAWRETNHPRLKKKCRAISIHSLRMEGDRQKKIRHPATMIISIHSLRMEGDRFARKRKSGSKPFQSTPSAWRETELP